MHAGLRAGRIRYWLARCGAAGGLTGSGRTGIPEPEAPVSGVAESNIARLGHVCSERGYNRRLISGRLREPTPYDTASVRLVRWGSSAVPGAAVHRHADVAQGDVRVRRVVAPLGRHAGCHDADHRASTVVRLPVDRGRPAASSIDSSRSEAGASPAAGRDGGRQLEPRTSRRIAMLDLHARCSSLAIAGMLLGVFAITGGSASYKQVLAVVRARRRRRRRWPASSSLVLNYFMRGSMSNVTNLGRLGQALAEKGFIARLLRRARPHRGSWYLFVLAIGLGVLYRRRTAPDLHRLLRGVPGALRSSSAPSRPPLRRFVGVHWEESHHRRGRGRRCSAAPSPATSI